MAIIKSRISLRNDSSANWLLHEDTILLKGEVGIEFDLNGNPRLKIGDGTTSWKNLPYFNADIGISALDNNLFVLDENNILSLLGFKDAAPGTYLIKDTNGQAIWVRNELDALINTLNNKVDQQYSIIDGVSTAWTLLSPENAKKLASLDINNNPIVEANNIIGLPEYITNNRNTISALLSEEQELKLLTIEPYAQENTIESICLGNTSNIVSIVNKIAQIPFASMLEAGVVKLSSEFMLDENDALQINYVHTNKLVQDADEELYLNCGTSLV